MNKKTIAIILELVPVVSALIVYPCIFASLDGGIIRWVIRITMALAFLGFAFFFVGRKLGKEYKSVRVLGVFDWLATISVIAFYILAIFSFGM